MLVQADAAATDRSAAAPGARTALALLLAINLFNYIDRQVLAAVQPAIQDEFFPTDPATGKPPEGAEEKIGLLATAFMVSYMVISPLFGWLADRMSRWLLVGIGVILWSLASGASGMAGHWAFAIAAPYTTLLITRCFVGIGEAAYGPVAPTIISDLYPVVHRGYVLAWFYAAIPVGSALGYVLGGLVFKWTGDWRMAFYVVVPPGLLLGVLCFFMPERRAMTADGGKAKPARLADLKTLLRTPSYVLDTLGMTAMTFALGGIAFWMPRYIVSKSNLDLGEVNLIFGGIVVVSGLGATIAGGIAGDKLRGRFPGSYFLVSGAAMLLGFPFMLLVIWAPFPLAWIFVFLACFCLFFNTGPTNTILANVTHPSMRASAFAINIFIIHAFGDAISPWLIGAIAGRSSLDVGLQVVSVLILLGGVFWLCGARYLERDTALAPNRLEINAVQE